MARKEFAESHNQTDVRYIRRHPKHDRFPVRRLGFPCAILKDHAPPIREESSASVCSFNSTPITLETTRRQSGGSHRGGRPRRPAQR